MSSAASSEPGNMDQVPTAIASLRKERRERCLFMRLIDWRFLLEMGKG